MKKVFFIFTFFVVISISIHWVIWRLFGIGIPAFFSYRNRVTQQCVKFSGDSYKTPWFYVIYKPDDSCIFKR